MGMAALKELLKPERKQEHEIVLLDLPTKENLKRLKHYEKFDDVDIVWGDLTNYADVLKCVTGADIVLHGAAIIPPAADYNPDLAWKVNVESARNIVCAIKAQPDPDAVRLVNIGTVAETGDRLPPIHVGRTGDPVKPSIFDIYGSSKIAAERIIAESGLRYWVSLRQTFIATLCSGLSPIIFHQPLNTCFELCSLHNAGLVFANVVRDDIPGDFWRRFYNIGGGPNSRTTYYEYLRKIFSFLGIQDLTKIFERKWFVLRNFHCQWFEDSNILNDYLHHQVEGLNDGFKEMQKTLPRLLKLSAKFMLPSLMKKMIFEPLVKKDPGSPVYWVEHGNDFRVKAFYGSKNAYDNIPDWDTDMPESPSWFHYRRLDHGYDEKKPVRDWELNDMRVAAEFRGGKCVSKMMIKGDVFSPLTWKCTFGHEFEASPNLVLKGGHWCPDCVNPPWNYDEEARRNPFFGQVWYSNHERDENFTYPKACVYDFEIAKD